MVFNVGNAGSKPLQIQARVFRWSQQGGRDVLEKTADVAVSPPVLSLNENGEGIVRLVRVANTPVAGEETYRVLFDELPSREKLQGTGVKVLIRQSIPVFFYGLDRRLGSLTWQTRREGGKTVLEARNQGQKRIRLMKMTVTDPAARQLVSIEGLAGYVFGRQRFEWELPAGEPAAFPMARLLKSKLKLTTGRSKLPPRSVRAAKAALLLALWWNGSALAKHDETGAILDASSQTSDLTATAKVHENGLLQETLFLTVFINGYDTKSLVSFHRSHGCMAIAPDD